MHDKRTAKTAIQRAAFALTGNPTAAQILTAIWWWEPYAKMMRDGKLWVVKTDDDFIEQDGVTAKPRAIRTAVALLTARELIETTRGPHPNGRAPNSRYLRLCEGTAARLESGTQGGRKRRIGDRIDQGASAASERSLDPTRPGTNSRFHIQGDNNSSSTLSANRKTTRKAQAREPRQEGGQEALEISNEIQLLQNAFDEGCKTRGWSAPFLNHPERVRRLEMFWKDCEAQKIHIELACKIAKRFAAKYYPREIAQALARSEEKVSKTPDHFNLSLCSNSAISAYREEWIESQITPIMLKEHLRWDEEEKLRDGLRQSWPLNEA